MIVVRLATGHWTGWIHQLRAVIISGRTASEGRLLSTPLAQVSPKRPPSNQQREEDSSQSWRTCTCTYRTVVVVVKYVYVYVCDKNKLRQGCPRPCEP